MHMRAVLHASSVFTSAAPEGELRCWPPPSWMFSVRAGFTMSARTSVTTRGCSTNERSSWSDWGHQSKAGVARTRDTIRAPFALSKIDRLVRPLPPGRVLEVGCLDGRYLEVLLQRGWDVRGLDIQPQPVQYILEHDAAHPFPFREEFDLVIAAEIDLVDTDAFLHHCANVLKPSGQLILTTPNLLFGVNRFLMLFGKRPKFAYADYHARMFVWDDLQTRIERRFVIRSVQGSHVLLGVRRFSMCSNPSRSLTDPFPRLAARFFVMAEKRSAGGDLKCSVALSQNLF